MMDAMWWAVTALAGAVAGFALWKGLTLQNLVRQLKRDLYYVESRLKRVPQEIEDAVTPLRQQLAAVAAGKPVSPELVRSGRLYLDISAAEAQRRLEADGGQGATGCLILDVRSSKEWATKRVPGAKLVPLEDLDQRHPEEIPPTAETIFVYCSSGDRSRLAAEFLARRGYTNVYHIQEGLQGWQGPVEGEGEVTFIKLERKR